MKKILLILFGITSLIPTYSQLILINTESKKLEGTTWKQLNPIEKEIYGNKFISSTFSFVKDIAISTVSYIENENKQVICDTVNYVYSHPYVKLDNKHIEQTMTAIIDKDTLKIGSMVYVIEKKDYTYIK